MEWLISNEEPDALYAPVLGERQLSSGAVKELVDLLPWYKRTPNMEVILAWSLATVLRSGFERSYLLRQMESLDIPREIAESFLTSLVDRGAGRFDTPRYFYNSVLQATPYKDGLIVRSQYGKSRLFVSETLFKCLQLLNGAMPRERYRQALRDLLGSEEVAEEACRSLAQQGLLLACNSPQTPVADYGPLRWNLEVVHDGELLDARALDKRLAFIEASFKMFFFQSKNLFLSPPVQLCGDFGVIARKASPAYFWDLSFKLQSFTKPIPVNLRLSAPIAREGWQELRLYSPAIFTWNFTADLRQKETELAEELLRLARNPSVPRHVEVTLLLDEEMPEELMVLAEVMRLKLYHAGCPASMIGPEGHGAVRHATLRSLTPFLRREGCGATLSPYIDGRGDVYTCPLEGAPCLGNIDSGAAATEELRRGLCRKYSGACRFGVNPGEVGRRGPVDRFVQEHRDLVVTAWSPASVSCP